MTLPTRLSRFRGWSRGRRRGAELLPDAVRLRIVWGDRESRPTAHRSFPLRFRFPLRRGLYPPTALARGLPCPEYGCRGGGPARSGSEKGGYQDRDFDKLGLT